MVTLPIQVESTIKEFFKYIDNERLKCAPDEPVALFLHGIMLGIREALESKDINVKGVTGLWWYEELGEPKRQKSTAELIETYGESENIEPILKGSKEGSKKIMEIIHCIN